MLWNWVAAAVVIARAPAGAAELRPRSSSADAATAATPSLGVPSHGTLTQSPFMSDQEGTPLPPCSTLAPPFCDCHPGPCSCASCGTCNNCLRCVRCDNSTPPAPSPPPPPPPAEWIQRAKANQMLVSTQTPADGFYPPFGNGFIGGDAGCGGADAEAGQQMPKGACGRLHVAGVFSQRTDYPVPVRAILPNPFALSVHEGHRIAAAVDLERGLFQNETLVSCGTNSETEGGPELVRVRTTLYAHRAHRSALVLEIEAIDGLPDGVSCTVALDACPTTPDWAALVDFELVSRGGTGAPGSPLTVGLQLHSAEQPPPQYKAQVPPTPPTAVGVAASLPNGSVTLVGGKQALRTFIAVFRTSLEPELSGKSPQAVAAAAADDLASLESEVSTLRAGHEEAWSELWEGGIEVEGNTSVPIAQTVNSSLYYILSAVRDEWPYGLSPGGLARNDYEGHSFWDTETWIFPNMVALYPAIALSLTQYRLARLPAAELRAAGHGYGGAMMPWESALLGFGVSRSSENDDHEIHISGDVPMAFRLYWRMSRNESFLSESWGLIRGAANFFASRVVQHESTGNWTLLEVVMPDEGAGVKNSSAYTNAIAGETLRFAAATAATLGVPAESNWTSIAARMYLPIVEIGGKRVHPEYEGYSVLSRPYINQADVGLMQYPLGLAMDHDVAVNDLVFYQARSSGPATAGFFTGDSAYSIAWLQMNNRSAADAQFDLAFSHMDLGVFNVWKEKNFGTFGNLNFITGAGGYLQNFVNGYAGLRYTDSKMSLQPNLPPHGATALVLRGLAYAGRRLTVRYALAGTGDSAATGQLSATIVSGAPLSVRGNAGTKTIAVGQVYTDSWEPGDVFTFTSPDPEQ